MKYALENNATRMILAHNHPSSNMQASKSDIDLTNKICEAANLFAIPVIDHIIVGKNVYLSFADEGILN